MCHQCVQELPKEFEVVVGRAGDMYPHVVVPLIEIGHLDQRVILVGDNGSQMVAAVISSQVEPLAVKTEVLEIVEATEDFSDRMLVLVGAYPVAKRPHLGRGASSPILDNQAENTKFSLAGNWLDQPWGIQTLCCGVDPNASNCFTVRWNSTSIALIGRQVGTCPTSAGDPGSMVGDKGDELTVG